MIEKSSSKSETFPQLPTKTKGEQTKFVSIVLQKRYCYIPLSHAVGERILRYHALRDLMERTAPYFH